MVVMAVILSTWQVVCHWCCVGCQAGDRVHEHCQVLVFSGFSSLMMWGLLVSGPVSVTLPGRMYHVPTDFALSFIPSWWPSVCINIGGCCMCLFCLFHHMSCIPNLPAGTCLATATVLSVGEACLANLPAQPRHRAYTAFEWASCLVEGVSEVASDRKVSEVASDRRRVVNCCGVLHGVAVHAPCIVYYTRPLAVLQCVAMSCRPLPVLSLFHLQQPHTRTSPLVVPHACC